MRYILAFLLVFCSVFVYADEIWIDVRTAEEYEAGHLAEVDYLIPFDQISNSNTINLLDKNSEILLYCRSGKRAEVARKALMDLGFSKVVNMGGLEDARQYVVAQTKP